MLQKSPDIVKSNALVEAAYRLSLMEQRVILACLSRIDPRASISADVAYPIPLDELVKLAGKLEKTAYVQAKEAALKLYRREIWIRKYPNGGGDIIEVTPGRWIQAAPFIDVKKQISLQFTTLIIPYISGLKKEFTRYNLDDIVKFNSVHSIRLYELICQYRNVGDRFITLADLRDMFQIGDKYKVTKDLKRYVLDAALKDINAKTPLQVSYESIKTGRAISGFRFLIAEKTTARPAPEKPAPAPRPRLTRAYIERHARPGESWDDAKARLSDALDR